MFKIGEEVFVSWSIMRWMLGWYVRGLVWWWVKRKGVEFMDLGVFRGFWSGDTKYFMFFVDVFGFIG